jgi:UDP-N-acetylmuramate--alanine ligase
MKKHYHFIGIGGIGMSALAHILLSRGHAVSGSDLALSANALQLQKEGAAIFTGHKKEHVSGADAVVYTTDLSADNPELAEAKEKKIPLYHRSELLAEMMEGYAPLLVTGTHGKTTTSSLLAHLLSACELDPSYAIGGMVRSLGSNGRHGKGIYFTAEADESDGTFLRYPCFGAIITNLDNDHLDFWKSTHDLQKAFVQFAKQVGSFEHLFWCKDDVRLASLGLKGYSYGFSEDADLVIDNFEQIGWKNYFDITFAGRHFRKIEIPLIGAHNVLNAAAVFGLGLKLDLPEEKIRKALATFEGVGRRLEKKGTLLSIDVYDDYAHHPTEIFATLRAVKAATHGRRIVVAFQPHRYSRTQDCMDEFPEAFDYADELIVTDIYEPKKEKIIPAVTVEDLVKKIKKKGSVSVRYVPKAQLVDYLLAFLKKEDVLVTMGAGDITHFGPKILSQLKPNETSTWQSA